MYLDQIFLLAGAISAAISLILIIYLVVSKNKNKLYRNVLSQETEQFDALRSTMQMTMAGSTNSTNVDFETSLPMTDLSDERTGMRTELETAIEERPIQTSLTDEMSTIALLQTSLSDASEAAKTSSAAIKSTLGFNIDVLEGKYELLGELEGGGMSRVFLVRKINTDNNWILKFIPRHIGKLTNEADILKHLNHKSLPQIIDIFHDESGTYIVESYIEGLTLDKVLLSNKNINEFIILDWAEQLTRVISYLHHMQPKPILHLDLKPSNIIVTRDNELMLIDFGISKQQDDNLHAIGATVAYAAPEQLKKPIKGNNLAIVEMRFGKLPEERLNWDLSERTDIYGLGLILFEMAAGQIPGINNRDLLKSCTSTGLFRIISKCIANDPANRFASADELNQAIQAQKQARTKMIKSLMFRRMTAVAAGLTILIAGSGFGVGGFLGQQEAMAAIFVTPDVITVSVKQSSEVYVEKSIPGSEHDRIDASSLSWDYTADRIAQVDGNRIIGLNVGETDLHGQYRQKEITLKVSVVEPINGIVEIAQQYQSGRYASVYAGSASRERVDGSLNDAEFVSPESLDIANDGSIYLADSGVLRRINADSVETITFDPKWLTPQIVRCFQDEVFILTNAWEDEDGSYYGIIRLSGEVAEGLYMTDAVYTAIRDLAVSSDGYLYFIERNEAMDATYLKRMQIDNPDYDIQNLCELSEGACTLTLDGERVYLADGTSGAISVYENGALAEIAGAQDQPGLIDGTAALFFMPTRIKYASGYLYVWDFNVLRRITLVEGIAQETMSLAGMASPSFDNEIALNQQPAEDIIWPNSRLMDFVVTDDNTVLLTDPKRGVIWRVM